MDSVRPASVSSPWRRSRWSGAGACAFDPPAGSAQRGASARPVRRTVQRGRARARRGGRTTPTPDSPGEPSRARPSAPKPATATTREPTRASPTPSHAEPCGLPAGGAPARGGDVTWPGSAGSARSPSTGGSPAADCEAIKRFQQRYGIRPAQGRAGPSTADVAQRLATTDTDAVPGRLQADVLCRPDPADGWAIRGGKVVDAADRHPHRHGRLRHRRPARTRSTGRNIKEWSNPYEVWMPYWQHFSRRDRLPRDHDVPAQHVDRLARLRQPAARGRPQAVGARQDRRPGVRVRPPPRHLTVRPAPALAVPAGG